MNEETGFTQDQLKRYSRNILVKEIGIAGQRALADSKILVIGAGGLGSPVMLYLAAAGVGTLGIADFDTVDLSNLQRQIIHTTKDIGRLKILSASEKIKALNPGVNVISYGQKLDAANMRSVIREYDFVVDAADNFSTKFLINDSCVFEDKPFSHGGVLSLEGQTITVIPHKTACFRCIFVDQPDEKKIDTSSQVGILGSIAGLLGTIQATEAVKFAAKIDGLLTDKLLTFDAGSFDFRKITVSRNPQCKACGIDVLPVFS